MNEQIHKSTAWVLDVDGCLMRTAKAGGAGGEPMAGAVSLLTHLRDTGAAVVVCTNASQRTPEQYAAHLRAQGLDVNDAEMVTAGSAAADFIAAHHPGARVLVVGAEGVSGPLEQRGVSLASAADLAVSPRVLADVVVVGAADNYDTSLINAACLAVDAGAPLYTTVDVPWFHGGLGKSVAVSATIASAIGWAAGVAPQVLGKPSPALAETLLTRLNRDAGEITVVGDATVEIELARHMGANSVLVLSGATSLSELDALAEGKQPDLALPGVLELHELLSSPSIQDSRTTEIQGAQR